MSTFYDAPNDYRNYLSHHGVKGMKWGVRKRIEDYIAISRHARRRKKAEKQLIDEKYGGDRRAYRMAQQRRAARRSRAADLERRYYSDNDFRSEVNKKYGIKDSGAKTPYEQHDSGESVSRALNSMIDEQTLQAWQEMGSTNISELDKRRLRR